MQKWPVAGSSRYWLLASSLANNIGIYIYVYIFVYILKMASCEPKQLFVRAIFIDNKVLCLTKILLFAFAWNSDWWTTTCYAQIWCKRNYKYGSLQLRHRFDVAVGNVVFVVDKLAPGHTSVWTFLLFYLSHYHHSICPFYHLGDAQYIHHSQ
jgi:hypothetical protein